MAPRLASVLEVIYLIFNEGYAATAGADWMRPALCEEALRLARVLVALAPHEPEVHGLLALMELQASRFARAHRRRTASRCCWLDQDRAAGTRCCIRRGLAALARAELWVGRRPLCAAGGAWPRAMRGRRRSLPPTGGASLPFYARRLQLAP